jgi:acyl carrier protein
MSESTQIDVDEAGRILRDFITRHFPGARMRPMLDHDDLLGSNIVDSIGILDLVLFIEKTFSISVEDEELLPETFQSIASMAEYVVAKLARLSDTAK